jgi:hypothetical protein
MAFCERPETKEARWEEFIRRLRAADRELPPIRATAPEVHRARPAEADQAATSAHR